MKKTTILLGMLSISMVYAQATATTTPPTGKVGVNTENPTEIFHVEGTARVKELPEKGASKIYTNADGASGSETAVNAFNPTKTVVADDNGVLGSIPYVLPAGDTNNTSLRWDGKKWIASPAPAAATTYSGSTSVLLENNNEFQRAALTGDVTAAKNNNNVTVTKIRGKEISTTAPMNNQVLAWNGSQWTPTTLTDNNDKSPWVKTADKNTPAKFGDHGANILFTGRVNVGSSSIDTTVSDKGILTLHGGDDQLLLRSGDNNKHWNVGTNAGWFRIRHYADKAGLSSSPVYNFILKETGSMMLSGGTGPNAMTNEGGNAGFFYEANGSKIGIHRHTGNTPILELVSHLDNQDKARAMYFEFKRGVAASNTVNNSTSAIVGYHTNNTNIFEIDNYIVGGDIHLKTNGGNGTIQLKGKAHITNIPAGNRGDAILVGKNNIVHYASIDTLLPAGSNGQVLTHNGTSWIAAAPSNANIYTTDGTITGDRTVTQASGGLFRFVKNGGGAAISFKTDTGNTAIHLDFYKGGEGENNKGHIGFGSSGNTNFIVGNKTGGTVELNPGDLDRFTDVRSKMKLGRAEVLSTLSNDNHYILLRDSGDEVVKRTKISTLLSGLSGSPWIVENTPSTAATNKGQNMYVSGKVGVGDFSNSTISSDNNVKLHVKGITLSNSFRGAHGADIFPDYVFQKYYTGTSSIKADYNFQSLSQVEDFVKANGHLPGYKSAEAIKKAGYIDVMETQLTNVEKIEELYLHLMEKEKEVKALEAKNADLEARLERLEKLLK